MSIDSRLLLFCLWLCLVTQVIFFSEQALAHGGEEEDVRARISASASVTWRNHGTVNENQRWQIPGIRMGGEAWPVTAGTEVDDAMLSAMYAIDPQTYLQASALRHAGHSSFDLEHFWFLRKQSIGFLPVQLEIGSMGAAFSPAAGWHASQQRFSEAPLLGDALFGRHFSDDGIRLQLGELKGFTLGGEIWKGTAFPATANESSNSKDAYLKYRWEGDRLSLMAGGWQYSGEALESLDTRYASQSVNADGHNHVHASPLSPVTNTPALDVYFTGDHRIRGGWVQLQWQWDKSWSLGIDGEYAKAHLSGDLQNVTPEYAHLSADYRSWQITPWIRRAKHTLSLRHEVLVLDNNLVGLTAKSIAQDAGLARAKTSATVPQVPDPERFTLQWRYQLLPALALRVEMVSDDTLEEAMNPTLLSPEKETNDRINIGLVWQQDLWVWK